MIVLETTQNVPLTLTENGTIRVTGSRVTLESVVYQYQQGSSAGAIRKFSSPKARGHSCCHLLLPESPGAGGWVLARSGEKARTVREDIESDPAYKARVGEK